MVTENLYASFFGFSERPFNLVPDPDFLFWSKQHSGAYAVLEFGIMSRAPITLLTGEIGSGKTTLVQKLLASLRDDVTVGLVSNAQGGRGELLQWVLNALGIRFGSNASYVEMFQKLQEFIIDEYAANRRVVLIIDEAQNLSIEGLEELRMLTNINSNKDELIQLILVGQPELKDLVLSPKMKQLAQRVAGSYHLGEMDQKTVGEYIEHRLKKSGGTGGEITKSATKIIYESTNGVPRLVNQLCELCLLYAWGKEEKFVGIRTVRKVLSDGVFFGGHALHDREELM
ncbi:hypothetical protein GCM10008927_11130 [Amylibacter ulvae]|uniref:AAA+ ATPase domain-containing protein n=1 Tax=Paramylibacter ulvae TaxID=1651968 RepID=A0ABQ3CYU6_9RHOB|nr:AAA family ATPase [Amylibacter ulvae]GHA47964.1 hypothetical protein GCM10008927_11130 [Amylibacter ulvae]